MTSTLTRRFTAVLATTASDRIAYVQRLSDATSAVPQRTAAS